VEEERGGGSGVYADDGDGVQQVGQGLRYSGIFGQTSRSSLSETDAPCRIQWNAPALENWRAVSLVRQLQLGIAAITLRWSRA
jgi:hypothetical protein